MGNINNYNFHYFKTRLSNNDFWDYSLSNDNRYITPFNGVLTGSSLAIDFDFNNPNIFSSGTTSGMTSGSTITSLRPWENAINNGVQLNDIGLTGLDNGLILYDHFSGDTGNTSLVTAFLTSTMEIPKENKSFFMTRVSGNTQEYIYPMHMEHDDVVGDYMKFCGGFYQGFYALDGFEYQVLPNRVNKGWVAEFVIKRDTCSGTTGTTSGTTTGMTLNQIPGKDNDGFFFYMGTRAENKFWSIFDGLNTGCTSACTTCTESGSTIFPTKYCTSPKETNTTSSTGYPLNPPAIKITEIKNNFLLYHRGRGRCCGEGCDTGDDCNNGWSLNYSGGVSGLTVEIPYSLYQRNLFGDFCEFDYTDGKFSECKVGRKACDDKTKTPHPIDPVYFSSITETTVDFRNPFLIYSRSNGHLCGGSCSGTTGRVGETVCSYSGRTAPVLELDYQADLIYNVFGFRITDDGRIGYRLIDKECLTGLTGNTEGIKTTGLTILEQYSVSGVVPTDEWVDIAIRFVADIEYDDCELGYKPQRMGRLYFYVNGLLKLVVNNFKEIILKRLVEDSTKQEGVPFNFSLGGGSQGLLESMTLDGQDPADMGLIIEEYFAGTFIGGISKFRFYVDDLSWCGIKNNAEYIQTI